VEETEIGEVSVDKLHEQTHKKAREEKHRAPWLQWLALSTALFAVLAAIASLKSGQLANESLLRMNEATLKQAKASDAWSYYQAKGIKQVARESEADVLSVSRAPADVITKVRAEADRAPLLRSPPTSSCTERRRRLLAATGKGPQNVNQLYAMSTNVKWDRICELVSVTLIATYLISVQCAGLGHESSPHRLPL